MSISENGTTGGFTSFIQTVANNTYNLVAYAGCAGSILGVGEVARALSVAGTFAIKINGNTVTGLSAVVPSTAGSFTAATAANSFVVGDKIQITYSATTAVLDHAISINYVQHF